MGPRAMTRFLTELLMRICYCSLLLASVFVSSFLLGCHSIVGALRGHFSDCCFPMCMSSSVDSIRRLAISRRITPVYGRLKM